MVKISNGYAKRYERLKKEYNQLKTRYEDIRKNPEKIRKIVSYRIKKHILDIVLFAIFAVGLSHYRNPIIIIMGLLTSVIDFWWELHCIQMGLWKYNDSDHLIKNKIPMGIPVTYFLIGAVGAVYVLFRLGL